MERCETCRFWGRADLADYAGIANPEDGSGWRRCDAALGGSTEFREKFGLPVAARMNATAADTYEATLWTAPDFGCTEHQPIS